MLDAVDAMVPPLSPSKTTCSWIQISGPIITTSLRVEAFGLGYRFVPHEPGSIFVDGCNQRRFPKLQFERLTAGYRPLGRESLLQEADNRHAPETQVTLQASPQRGKRSTGMAAGDR